MKNLRWDDESWVKMYTRDPAEFLALSFDASGLLLHLWRKVDKSGVFAVGEVDRSEVAELLALTFRIDTTRMDAALSELIRRKFVVVAERDGQQVVAIPDFEPAQSARATDRVRQQEKRKRDRDAAISSAKPLSSSRAVTLSHAPSRIEEKRSERRDQREEKRSSPIGEGVQGEQPPKTDPTPTLRRQKLDEVVGRGPASWGMEGSGQAYDDPAKALTPTPRPTPPSPPSPRQAPAVAVVEQMPKQTTGAAGGASRGRAQAATGRLFQEPATTSPKSTPKAKTRGRSADDEGEPLPADWAVKNHHYAYAREKLGAQKKHVDYWADDMRDQAALRGWRTKDWDAKFRTFMRKALEFAKGALPNVPEPLPPKVPMPPCPPPSPIVLEGARRAKERMERGESFLPADLFARIGMKLPPLPPDPPDVASNG